MVSIRSALEELLPTIPVRTSDSTEDEQIRSVLRPLVELALRQIGDTAKIESDPALCPNCNQPVENERTPYCSVRCKETAGFIRQFRNSLLNRNLLDPVKQVGTGQALWSLQGGGYPRRQQMVPARVIAKVIERDGGKCSVCGEPATEIDHTGSG